MQKFGGISNIPVMKSWDKLLLLLTICFKEIQDDNYPEKFKPTLIYKGTNKQGNDYFKYELPNGKYFYIYINKNGEFMNNKIYMVIN